ncbi:MAG: glycoside hydrolase family 15 protein [Fimbriimonadaceae bacterium]|nr:glycoside hydrolase family 15 protein [Fimbriimonadaceae bacterium]QYK55369.1 MAG: glycoside hydrolase family 15 protein [Fimbriimonadaceae bacterium]
MPRPLVLGNGRLLIAFDQRYAIRDLCFPYVGYPNHLLGHRVRQGVYVDGHLSWCDSEDWQREMGYQPDTLVAETKLLSWKSGLELQCTDAVDPELPVYVRRVRVKELRSIARPVKLYFTQHFMLGQSDVGNTALYFPFRNAVVHYRGPYYVMVAARTPTDGIEEFSTGLKGFNGLEGTWRDAEDGRLEGNPIAQGSVDSTFGVSAALAAGGEAEFCMFMVLAERLDEADELMGAVEQQGLDKVFERQSRSSKAFLKRAALPAPVSPEIDREFKQSLLLMQTQIDAHGAVLAANDSDILETNRATYSYCWPRDGACVVETLCHLGLCDFADRFFEFCERAMPHDRPFLLQKYRADGNLGASWHPWVVDGHPEVPFQQDETALVLSAVRARGLEAGVRHWEKFVRPAADFMVRHRDREGLPLPSWDLWEERRGIHAFTTCCVWRALEDSGEVAEAAGDAERAARYLDAARQMRDAFGMHFWQEDLGRFVRMLSASEGVYQADRTPDSAIVFGLLRGQWEKDGKFRKTLDSLREDLRVETVVGGYARYAQDYYFRRSEAYPGNPWIICSLWFAQAELYLRGMEAKDDVLETLAWVCSKASPTGVLPEQLHPETGEHLSVSPLTWSHAEFVATVLALDAARQ